MDQHEELATFKWLMFVAIVFLFATYRAYKEFKYAIWGATTTASVPRTFETFEMRRLGRRKDLLAVEYSFTDRDGNRHRERDDVPI